MASAEAKIAKIKPTTNFTRFVEIGRVCLINFGPYEGKICVIIDVVDQNRALVSGPEKITGVPRHAINFKRLILTGIKITVGRGSRQKALTKEFVGQNVQEKWEKTGLFKKQNSRAKRANMNDFDRFKCMIAKKKKNKIIKEAEKTILHAQKWKGKEPKRKRVKGEGKSAKKTGGKKPEKTAEKKSTHEEKHDKPVTKQEEKQTKAPPKKPAEKKSTHEEKHDKPVTKQEEKQTKPPPKKPAERKSTQEEKHEPKSEEKTKPPPKKPAEKKSTHEEKHEPKSEEKHEPKPEEKGGKRGAKK